MNNKQGRNMIKHMSEMAANYKEHFVEFTKHILESSVSRINLFPKPRC